MIQPLGVALAISLIFSLAHFFATLLSVSSRKPCPASLVRTLPVQQSELSDSNTVQLPIQGL